MADEDTTLPKVEATAAFSGINPAVEVGSTFKAGLLDEVDVVFAVNDR